MRIMSYSMTQNNLLVHVTKQSLDLHYAIENVGTRMHYFWHFLVILENKKYQKEKLL